MTKVDIVSWTSRLLLISRLVAIAGRAGEMMVDERSVINENVDMRIVTIHLFLKGQFLGFFGSAGLSQVT